MVNIILNYLFKKVVEILDISNKKKILKFFKKKFKCPLFLIDVGAHEGETIKFFLKNFKIEKILAFEPNKKVFNNLNKFSSKNIKIYNLGIGQHNEFKKLNCYKDTSSSSYNNLNKNSSYFKRKRKLSFDKYNSSEVSSEIQTLNFFFSNQLIKKVDILKIDTEGFEFNVLKGISKDNFKKIKYIYFEHHYNNMVIKNYKFSNIHEYLVNNNFFMQLKIKMQFRKTFEYIYKNSLY